MSDSTFNIEDKAKDVAARLRSLADAIETGEYDYQTKLSIKGFSFKYELEATRKVEVPLPFNSDEECSNV
tara:strand:- start:27189 stop:27398 length:210 start_codon:yes stop_codon:yes gene_type:complete